MTNLTNLQRDMLHTSPETDQRCSFPPGVTIGSNTINNSASDPAVKQSIGYAISLGQTTNVSAGQWTGIGCYMTPPEFDAECYRVKAYAEKGVDMYVFWGFAPASPTGTEDLIDEVQAIPMLNGQIDEVIRFEPPDQSGQYAGRPVCIGIAAGENATGRIGGHITVQRLSTASPQYSSSVS